jgi:hypothetical protein
MICLEPAVPALRIGGQPQLYIRRAQVILPPRATTASALQIRK